MLDIRADIGAALLNEGEFNPPAPGLTVFIRQLGNDGQIRGILVHDSRDAKRPVTYLAERGVLAQTPQGTRLIMFDGTVEQSARGRQPIVGAEIPARCLRPGPVRRARADKPAPDQ